MKPPLVRSLFPACFVALAAGALLASASARAANSFNTLLTFDPGTDGNVPYAALVQGADGKFYGTNTTGGRSDNGTIFSLSPGGGDFTVLNTFTQSDQGIEPEGHLVQASDGNFYGATSQGGVNNFGTLYRMIPATGKLSILFGFTSGDPGSNPVGGVIQARNGFLYGTAEFGGTDGYGTVYLANIATGATGTLADIGGGSAGINPESDLIQGTDGNFYGSTSTGGTNNLGTIFQVTPGGVYNTLYTFAGGTDGGDPLRGVVQGADGAFYGIANAGGTGGSGVIFKLTVAGATGTLTPIYAFQPDLGDGTDAIGQLIQASDGNFYGTTTTGGTDGDGTIFRVTPAGGFLTLYSFTDSGDGGDPIAGLTQGNDGKLYGTTAGEVDSDGTIFVADLGLPVPKPAITVFSPISAKAGDTIAIQGSHLVGTTAVSFAGADGKRVPATSFRLASNAYVTAVVPADAVTGVLMITANGLSATSTSSLALSGTPPPTPTPTPNEESTVSVLATDPVAAFLGNNVGRFTVTRTGGSITKPSTVIFGIGPKSTAVRGKDYRLTTHGETLATVTNSITIPAGVRSVGITVVPIASPAQSRPDKLVIFNVKAGEGYKLAAPVKARVNIAGYTSR